MEYVLLVLQLLLGLGVFLLWLWIKQLPAAIHKRQEQLFQQQLAKELELLKISQMQIQPQKIERFMDFAKLQAEILANDDLKSRMKKRDPKATAKLRELVIQLGAGLFLFASDSTIREYGSWKTNTAMDDADPYAVLSALGKLMVALRKDIGYENTQLVGGDYLKLFITDWDDIKSKITT